MATNELHLQMHMLSDDLTREMEAIEEAIINPMVRRKLHVTLFRNDTSRRNQDALDLVCDIRLRIIAELRNGGTSNGGIRDLPAYAATVAFNACHQHFRERYPRRASLRNKLRYLLTHHDDFGLWQDPAGRRLCGLAPWTARDDHFTLPGAFENIDLSFVGAEREGSAELLRRYFVECGGPVFFDDLVNTVAAASGLSEPTVSDEDPDETSRSLSDPKPRIDAQLELTARMRLLWEAVLQLPDSHRKALLLNLRDNGGDNLLAALPLTGVATIRQIADAVGIPFEQLVEIWNTLPWEDNRIAEHLGLARQQVINLRQTARAKLIRWRNDTGNI